MVSIKVIKPSPILQVSSQTIGAGWSTATTTPRATSPRTREGCRASWPTPPSPWASGVLCHPPGHFRQLTKWLNVFRKLRRLTCQLLILLLVMDCGVRSERMLTCKIHSMTRDDKWLMQLSDLLQHTQSLFSPQSMQSIRVFYISSIHKEIIISKSL